MGKYDDIADDNLSVTQVIELEESDADDDQERAQRINSRVAETLRDATRGLSSKLLGQIDSPALGFTSELSEAVVPRLAATAFGAVTSVLDRPALGFSSALSDSLNAVVPSFADLPQASTVASLASDIGLGRTFELPAVTMAGQLDFSSLGRGTGTVDLPAIRGGGGFVEMLRRDQDEVELRLDEVSRVVQERDDHKFEAEQAAIDTSKLIDALVKLSEAQQAQLVNQGTLLQAMVEQTATLTAQTIAQSQQDEARWKKSWRLQQMELIAGIIAALLAGAAIWAAFAASRPVVVKVPPPIVQFQTATTNATSSPASRLAE